MDSLRETLAAAKLGERAALDELFARTWPRLVAFVRAHAGGVVFDRESALDIAQSVCREALENLDRFDDSDEDGFRRWLFVRAVKKICNRRRFLGREKRDVGREEELATDEDILSAFATISRPSRHASAREELRRFEAALETLPDPQREAIALTRVAGLSYAEAAVSLQRSESAVRGLVMRGLSAVAAILEREAGAS